MVMPTITLGVKISAYEFVGDTNIQTKHAAKEKSSKVFYQTEDIIQNVAQRDEGKI